MNDDKKIEKLRSALDEMIENRNIENALLKKLNAILENQEIHKQLDEQVEKNYKEKSGLVDVPKQYKLTK